MKKVRILIVEDEVRLAETLRDLLELEHYTADISHDGESGLDNALSDIYDLVILDVCCPKRTGSLSCGSCGRPERPCRY